MVGVVHRIHYTHTVSACFIVWIWRVNLNCLRKFVLTRSTAETLPEVFVCDVPVDFISAWCTEWLAQDLIVNIRLRLVAWPISWVDNRHHSFFIYRTRAIQMWIVLPGTWTELLNVRILLLSPERILWLSLFTNCLRPIEVVRYGCILCRTRSTELTVEIFLHSNFLKAQIY